MRDNLKNVVLVFQGSLCQSNREELDGIYRFARERDWRIQTVEYGAASENRLNLSDRGSVFQVRPLISFWKPIGCIVECSGLAPRFRVEDFGKTPTVFLDRHPSTLPKSASCVFSDADSIAGCAAKELLALGCANYAFVPWVLDAVWSRERGEKFAQLVRMNGKRIHFFDSPFRVGQELKYRKALEKWISRLPRPCGIFAANDCLGEQVLTACLDIGVSVPDDIAVLGVDDDLQICENTTPTLSSIQIDSELAGYLSASQLHQKIDGKSGRSCSFGVRKLNRRASTYCLAKGGHRIAKALEFIRLHACDGIGVSEVVEQMGCSRRLADLRFRENVGCTILQTIHQNRIAKAKALIADGSYGVQTLADFCGYRSVEDFSRVFKRMCGVSPSRWNPREETA